MLALGAVVPLVDPGPTTQSVGGSARAPARREPFDFGDDRFLFLLRPLLAAREQVLGELFEVHFQARNVRYVPDRASDGPVGEALDGHVSELVDS
jgi:hypothetical protein